MLAIRRRRGRTRSTLFEDIFFLSKILA